MHRPTARLAILIRILLPSEAKESKEEGLLGGGFLEPAPRDLRAGTSIYSMVSGGV